MDRKRTMIAVLVTALFALPILQYGFLQTWRDELNRPLPNDGMQASFFVLHARPFYVVPEDFHLYVVRAKRIAERGWTGDLLWGRDADAAQTVSAAPLQVGLGYIAYLTGGEPLRYTLFLMTLVFVSWSTLVLIALKELRTLYGFTAVLAFSLLVAVCEVPQSLFTLVAGYMSQLSSWPADTIWSALQRMVPPSFQISSMSADKIWPAYKALRFSTHSWSLPLFVALAILAAKLVGNGKVERSALALLAVIVVLFALGDVWSLFLSFGVLGLAWVLRSWMCLRTELRRGLTHQAAFKAAILYPGSPALIGIAVGSIALFAMFPGPSGADAVARAGFGPWWRGSSAGIGGPYDITISRLAGVWVVYSAITFLALFVRRRGGSVTVALIGGLPLATASVLSAVFWIYGADAWQTNQFHDRVYASVFLSLLIQGWSLVRFGLATRVPGFAPKRLAFTRAARVVACLLGVFLVLHVGRIHIYIQRVAVPDYALTKDIEALKVTLQQLDQGHRRASFATMSHEINYLAALWTDFDLVLPEGFPLHFAGSNQEIARRMAGLLRFYGATRESWTKFNLRMTPKDQVDWLQSRVLSEREGFSYYLYHRQEGYGVRGTGDGGTIALVDNALSIQDKIAFRPKPDIVVIDPTSNEIGRPNLDGYMLIKKLSNIEVWTKAE